MTSLQIERRKVYELVAERLVAAIAAHQLKPGDPVPSERDLTEQFDVGRSSVREALRLLESKGLITAGPKGSLIVAEFKNPLTDSLRLLLSLDEVNTRELYELRLILESEAAALAAERRQDEHIAPLAAAIDEMQHALDTDAPQEYIDADLRFHLGVAEASGNRLLFHSMTAVRDLLRRVLQSIYLIPGSPETSVIQHTAILDAIKTRNPDAARETMRAHLVRVKHDVERVLDGQFGSTASREGQL